MAYESRSERRRRERAERKGNFLDEQAERKGNFLDERVADLAQMDGCDEAHQAQAMLYMVSYGDFTPVPCPHCGETPVFAGFSQNISPDLPGYEGV